MTDIIYYAGLFCLVWMGMGLLAFIGGAIGDAYLGRRVDGEWQLGLAICIGAGPYIFAIMIASFFRDWRQSRFEKTRER